MSQLSHATKVGMITNDESAGRSSIDLNRFLLSTASKIGAGTTEVILVVAIAANYFSYKCMTCSYVVPTPNEK